MSRSFSIIMKYLKFIKDKILIAVTVVLAVIYFHNGTIACAAPLGGATFQWQANQAEEYVTGYRLYYGPQSRFKSDGTLKVNFSYPQYIDLTEMTRCSGSDYSSCEILSSTDLQCINYSSATPSCTVNNLNGTLYFAMTAYSNTAESGYTQEIKFSNSADSKNLIPIINMLLLED